MSRVVHFEIHASKPQALIEFYSSLLGWSFQKWEGPMDYWVIVTGPADQPGINGGLIQRMGDPAGEMQAVNAYVCTAQTAALDATVAKGVALGGVVALPKMAIPGVGWLAYIKDTDGNILGLMEADEKAK
jgi:uncharacterized protein